MYAGGTQFTYFIYCIRNYRNILNNISLFSILLPNQTELQLYTTNNISCNANEQ